jgi:hypothetical protein
VPYVAVVTARPHPRSTLRPDCIEAEDAADDDTIFQHVQAWRKMASPALDMHIPSQARPHLDRQGPQRGLLARVWTPSAKRTRSVIYRTVQSSLSKK